MLIIASCIYIRRYSDTERAKTGHQYGVATAARHYSKVLKLYVKNTSVYSIGDIIIISIEFKTSQAV